MNKKPFSKISKYLPQILAMLFLAGFVVFAWTEPSQAPPGGNVPAPLNISATAQTKAGNLTIQGFLSTLQDFVVGNTTIKKDGSVSTNLNADKLDDLHAADISRYGLYGVGSTYCSSCYSSPYWCSCGEASYPISCSTVSYPNGTFCNVTCAFGTLKVTGSSSGWSGYTTYYSCYRE